MFYEEIKIDQKAIEEEILRLWDKEGTFKKSLEIRKNAPPFVFYEGPPTANGRPGIHHIFARTLKDIVCRYRTMKGFLVERKAGWDTHGLPVEREVEQELGFKSKADIYKYGIDKFNEACKISVFKYKAEWEELTRRIGYWLDLENAYITCDRKYIETLWWLLARIWEKGLIYKDYKILPYCPRCGTGLSDHEESLGYEEVDDPSLYVKMKLLGETDTYFLVWTTTPWTLLSNVALAVHPEAPYVKVKLDNEFLILARPRLVEALKDKQYQVVEEFLGEKLLGKRYEPIYKFVEFNEDAYYVIGADFVSMEDGTGIVHIAPAFGREDFAEGKKYNLPFVQLIDPQGLVKSEAKGFAGLHFKEADPKILEDLKARGILFSLGTIRHTYPFCWRCGSPLLQYARSSWYIRTTAVKDKLIENNQKINWVPPEIGKGRFGEWLENNIDWALSRERFWGTPLNIWICSACGKEFMPSSFAELREMATTEIPEDFDPHKPYVDTIKLRCPACAGEMNRVPEVIDCWFDSGAMPYAQYHYPFEEPELFPKRFPADFISEGVDQTRGWFYTLLAISTMVDGVSSYKNVLVVGLVLDKFGMKMSKSKGNVVMPGEVIEKYGADPLRFYLATVSQPWLPINFSIEDVGNLSWKFFDTLRNIYNFFSLYANIDGYNPIQYPASQEHYTLIDRWILSRVENLTRAVDELLSGYQITRAARLIRDFVIDEFSNWYIRRCRRRFWGSGIDDDKRTAYGVLLYVFERILHLVAPFAPMTADYYYRKLRLHELPNHFSSVHLSDFPQAQTSLIDENLESQFELAIKIASVARSARAKCGIKIRQPLRRMITISTPKPELHEEVVKILKDELNIKEIEFASERSILYESRPKINFAVAGKKFGSAVQKIKEILPNLKQEDIELLKENKLKLTFDGKEIVVTNEDVVWEESLKEGFSVEEDGKIIVGIYTTIDEELRAEGFARELVNKIQQARKNAGFHPADKIELGILTTERLKKALTQPYLERIAREVLAQSLIFGALERHDWKEKVEINGEEAELYLKKQRS